jgi:hypothetical protein
MFGGAAAAREEGNISLERRNAARQIAAEASNALTDLLGDLAELLAEYLVNEPVVEALARVAALLEAENRGSRQPL